MSNNSNNELIAILGIAILAFLALVAWFAKSFGLDYPTSIQVVMRFVFLGIALAAATFLVKHDYLQFFSILPLSIVGFLSCWLPAFDYWAGKNISHMGFEGIGNSVWYATGWIQGLIALTIIAGGHGLIYYADSNRNYR